MVGNLILDLSTRPSVTEVVEYFYAKIEFVFFFAIDSHITL